MLMSFDSVITPNAKALPHQHVPAKAGIRKPFYPIAKADGFYGLSDKREMVNQGTDSHRVRPYFVDPFKAYTRKDPYLF